MWVVVLPLMVTTKINRKSQVAFYCTAYQEVWCSAAMCSVGLRFQQANLPCLFVLRAAPSASIPFRKGPHSFIVQELLLTSTSLILVTVIYVADKSIPLPQSRRHEDWEQPHRCSPWLSKAAVRDCSAEFSRASWAILCSRLEETTIEHFSAIPANARNLNDWPLTSKGSEHTWQLTKAGAPFLALAQQGF